MFRIGFSKKYFTLWKVVEKKDWTKIDGINIPFKKVTKQFIKNLSSDEMAAKRKAIFEGVENFEIDLSLCGIKFLIKQYLSKSDDELFFEFCESRSEILRGILLHKGFVDIDGQIVYPEHFKKIINEYSMKTNQETIQEFTEKIKEIKALREEIKKERLLECEFEIGEKVNVYSKIGFRYSVDDRLFVGQGFIKGINVDDEGEFFYKLKKAKKDGTESSFGFGYYWGNFIIEKLNYERTI
jgi:hypothetical protein